MSKQTVRYRLVDGAPAICVRARAIVAPIDHTSDLVSNSGPAMTTPVINYDKSTGRFETLNTIYLLEKNK